MSRKIHTLSDETINVVNGKASKVADEYDCTSQFIHAILSGTETDPFAKFVPFYSAAKRAGCDTSPWRNRLDAIDHKYTITEAKCVRTETLAFVREAGDVPLAVIGDKPLYDQLREVNEAITKAERLKASLIQAISDEQENGGRTRIPIRDYANGEVKKFRGVK